MTAAKALGLDEMKQLPLRAAGLMVG